MTHSSSSAVAPRTGRAYFKYHGAWAPGVRIFRRLSFPAKAACITLAFVAPLLLLCVLYVQGRLAELRGTALERQGTAYVMEVQALAKRVEALQSSALREATQMGGEAGEARRAVEQQLVRVERLDKAMGTTLNTTAAFGKVRESLAKAAPPADGVMKVYSTHSSLGKSVRDLVTAAADGSGLTLDPELDTYYLMDAAVLRLPQAIDQVARTRSLAAAAAGIGLVGEVAGVELNRLDALTEELLLQTAASMNKVIGAHPESKATLDLTAAVKLVDSLRDQATDAPGTGGKERAAKFQALGDQALAGLYAAQGAAQAQLDGLLAVRERRARQALFGVVGAVLAALLVAAYMFQSFYIVMKGGLDEVRRHLDLMADGDLTSQPLPWGRDEAAHLMTSLAHTQESMRSIVGQVRDAAENIASASQQISQGAGDMSGRTERAAAALQESSSSMTRIGETVSRTVESASDATALAQDNAKVAGEGGRIVGTMVSTMDAINGSSNKIADIIGVIDGIAFQTNILALNAAVEAARAGEQGRGFAVVAGEVRSLAQRSSSAAREIKTLIGESVGKVEEGTHVVRRAGDTMSRIVANADRIRASLDTIAGGAREQQQGLQAIGGSVRQLDDATQQNAALSEQTAAAATSLNQQAQELVHRVARFKLPAMERVAA